MPDRPNVLLISADHWFGRLIGALGHPTVLTPTLDQLIGNGVAYTNAYTATPSCIPARREIMTGVSARTHGDRVFNEYLPMPDLPTMAQTFRDNGYQAFSVGKLHVYPQHDRIGFDDALINEEGRHHLGLLKDDYELFLQEQGYAGQEATHAMGHNDYIVRPWHLPEHLHQTNWTVRQMSRYIARRDPGKPGFWYMSFSEPHPPIVPPEQFLTIYRDREIDMPFVGEWAKDWDALPSGLKARRWSGRNPYSEDAVRIARQGFYAMCTHLDHQIRLVIGMLREEGLLDNTVVMFTSDHGEMLGNHGQWAKDLFYEESAKIPMVLMPPANRGDIGKGVRDDRLVVQADIFPTLADICGVPVPDTVEGMSMIGDRKRDYIYGEHWENETASRMIRDARYKLIYYPLGNQFQLFDLDNDPDELHDLAHDPSLAEVRERLTCLLIENLYGSDLAYLQDGKLVGVPDDDFRSRGYDRNFGGQRGWRFGTSGKATY